MFCILFLFVLSVCRKDFFNHTHTHTHTHTQTNTHTLLTPHTHTQHNAQTHTACLLLFILLFVFCGVSGNRFIEVSVRRVTLLFCASSLWCFLRGYATYMHVHRGKCGNSSASPKFDDRVCVCNCRHVGPCCAFAQKRIAKYLERKLRMNVSSLTLSCCTHARFSFLWRNLPKHNFTLHVVSVPRSTL